MLQKTDGIARKYYIIIYSSHNNHLFANALDSRRYIPLFSDMNHYCG